MIGLKINIPRGFLDEETRDGYVVTKEMKEIWAVELDLLCEFDRVCKKNGIRYFADGGTLLGAVREKGFIPWDDDIDLIMFRAEYERLCEVANEFESPYFFQTAYTDKQYGRGHAQFRNSQTTAILEGEKGKVSFNQGIFIDIFILDGVIDDDYLLENQKRQAQAAWDLQSKLVAKKGHKEAYQNWEKIVSRYSVDECENVAPLGFIFETKKRIRNKHIYDGTLYLPFEFIRVPAPVGYDDFLGWRYGDYMTPALLPTTHGDIFFDTNKSYLEYLNKVTAKVSIIMPSLNVGAYIVQAVRSALTQTLRDIEVICIDAGSSDGTWELLNGMARQDDRLIIIRTSIKSYGYQVNLGVSLARGDYIAVLETDDFVDKNMYEVLYQKAIENDLDYIKADYKAYWTQNNGKKVFLNRKNPENEELYDKVLDPKDYPALGADDWYLWTGIYKKDFVLSNHIMVSETQGAAFQDIGFLIRTMQAAERVMYVRNRFYNYCIDRMDASSNGGEGLKFAYGEFCGVSINEIKRLGGEELFYARMAKSYICNTSGVSIETLNNEENKKYFDWFAEQLKKGIAKGKLREGIIAKSLWEKTLDLLDEGIGSVKKDIYAKEMFIREILAGQGTHRVVIFGCGNYGYGAYRWMRSENIPIVAFMDNNSNLWGTSLNDIPVMNPIECTKLPDDMKYIIANAKYADDIKVQLLRLGIKEDNLYIF